MPTQMTLAQFAQRLEDVSADLQTEDLMQQMALGAESAAKDQIAGPLRAWKTGTLARSTTGRVISPTQAVVGTNENYGLFVHDGTKFMPARPWLKAGIEQLVGSGQGQQILNKWAQQLLDRIAR